MFGFLKHVVEWLDFVSFELDVKSSQHSSTTWMCYKVLSTSHPSLHTYVVPARRANGQFTLFFDPMFNSITTVKNIIQIISNMPICAVSKAEVTDNFCIKKYYL